MAQSFTPGYPPTSGSAVSLTERGNWAAILSSHAGAALPGYAVEGMPFFDTVLKHLNVVKLYGSKAFSQFLLGPQLRLAISLKGAGQDGSTYGATIRVRRDSQMPGIDKVWTLVGSAVAMDFNVNYAPSYFAEQVWNDSNYDEPVIWTADGKLLNKTWETIPTGDDENVYSTSPSPLSNDVPFISTTPRAVDLEERTVALDCTTLTADIDHVVTTLPWPWWQVQDDLIEFDLIEEGRHRPANTFKAVPFMWGGTLYVVVYNLNVDNQTLEAFHAGPRKLIVTRKV